MLMAEPIVQRLARKWGRNWEEEFAQELRLRVVQAYRSWDPQKNMSLKNWTWRVLKDGSSQQRWLEMHYLKGARNQRVQPEMADIDKVEIGVEPDLETGDYSRVVAEVRAILESQRNSITAKQMMARLLADEHGDLTKVAKEQGVSKQAIRASRQRMLTALQERMACITS